MMLFVRRSDCSVATEKERLIFDQECKKSEQILQLCTMNVLNDENQGRVLSSLN